MCLNDIAIAEPCNETSFSRSNSRLYNNAHTAFVEQQDLDAATDKLEKLTRKRGLNCYERGTALRLGAEIKLMQGDFAGSVAYLETVIDQELGNGALLISTRQTIYKLYIKQENYQAAADSAEMWIALDGQPAGIDAVQLAALFFETGRIDSAVEAARAKLEMASGPNKVTLYRYLFDLHTVNSDTDGLITILDQFEAFLNTAQMSDRERSNGWGSLVSAYSYIQQNSAALDIMNMRVDRDDTLLPSDWYTLAHLNYEAGNFAEAVEWGEQLRAADGDHVDITLHALLYLSYVGLGDTEASAVFREKIDSDQPPEDIIDIKWDPTDTATTPISPPLVSYPSSAASRGTEGQCLVFFDVDSIGVPFNVDAECTDRRFKLESVRAVGETRFSPKIADGLPRNRRNVTYPLVFTLGR